MRLHPREHIAPRRKDYADLLRQADHICSRRIVNEVKGISRVVYDISGKPPATIDWK